MKNITGQSHKFYDNATAIDLLHQLSILYTGTKRPHDYGTGEEYTYAEVHLLKKIADNPGITVTELAYEYAKTMGAISQIVKRIMEKGLIVKETASAAGNTSPLYLTPKGRELNEAHFRYDIKRAGETMDRVREIHSDEEINIAFSVIEDWLKFRRAVHKQRLERNKQ